MAISSPHSGPWEYEPDEVDFEAHGLPCRLRRGPMGHWCGYVGVDESHPWYGRSYDDQVEAPDHLWNRSLNVDDVGPINMFCASILADPDQQRAAIGLLVDVHGGLTWSDWKHGHGEPDGRWWFGFDCNHCDDFAPQMPLGLTGEGVYRDQEYAAEQAERVARQLAEIGQAQEAPR